MVITYALKLWFAGLIGLGTSTAKEAKEYFSDMVRHRIPFKYTNAEDDTAIELVGYVTTLTCTDSLAYWWFCSIWMIMYTDTVDLKVCDL